MSIQHMQTVFDAGDLTAPQKAVLLAYCNFTDPHGYCWPGVERIADMTGLSVSGVKKVRKQLLESKLLTTVNRGKQGGGRKTNGSRINVKKLQKMKLPPRDYDDNLMPELGFEEDDEPDAVEAKVPEGHTNGSPEAQQKYPGGTNEGTCGDPYPSVDPSDEPSGHPSSSASGHAEREPAPVAAEKTKRKKRESPEEIIIERLPEEHITHDEAKAVADLIDRRGAGGGQTIRSLTTWIANRDERELRRDLEAVRLIERSPEVEYTGMENCALHSIKIVGGACSSCMGDIKAGDEAAVRDHADMAGSKYRPDLFRALGMPLDGSEGARSGARGRVPDHNFWDHVTDGDLKRLVL